MYAVIKTGGKQYRVAAGETLQVEKLEHDPGETIQINEVLLLADGENVTVGRPLVDGASVEVLVMDQAKHRKVLVFRFRRRKRYRRKNGHRQPFTALKVTAIHAAVAQ